MKVIKEITGVQVLKNETLADEEIISIVCQQTDTDKNEIEEEEKDRQSQ